MFYIPTKVVVEILYGYLYAYTIIQYIYKVVDSVGPKLLVKRLVIRKIFLGRGEKNWALKF